MVVSWLVHSVSPNIRHNILWMDDAQAILKDLRSRFFQGDLLRISELQRDASSLKQGTSTISEFYTKLRIIWDELENFRLDPICTCAVQYSCKTISTIAHKKHEDRAL
ncbi:hypothetical protein V8G54_001318 [Vigna mungo]|uniref:Retrotransposon gag domain-containing protein n=1 Tax=Vigna mungo TaxID=3915 RepID=A0AAQ3SBP3_VIGMU